MEDKTYTTVELEAMTIHELRLLLRKLGGTPGSKNCREIMDEIVNIQTGKYVPKQTKRGRKPKELKVEDYVEEARRSGVKTDEESNIPPYRSTFGEIDGVYTKDDVFVPLNMQVNDSGNMPEIAHKMVIASGILEIMQEGYGFLRNMSKGKKLNDFFVDRQLIRQYNLRNGDEIIGYAVTKNDKGSMYVTDIVKIDGIKSEQFKRPIAFEQLTATYPTAKISLDNTGDPILRAIDLLSPIGMGQRGLVVAPPKTGKTTLLKKLAMTIENRYPDLHLIVLLIDERPEEVTDIASCITRGEVVSSTFDEGPEKHIKYAELYLERAKRMAENGEDVVILLDSLTRLTRAYNTVIPSSGKTLTGGIDAQAFTFPKRFFGAARKLKEGGTLTIIATALIETGSKMDEVIFEEFKGTGNMEIVLSGNLAEKRIFPAVDMWRSGTRRDEFLLNKDEMDAAYKIRRFLSSKNDGTEIFLEMLKKSRNNDDLMLKLDNWINLLK